MRQLEACQRLRFISHFKVSESDAQKIVERNANIAIAERQDPQKAAQRNLGAQTDIKASEKAMEAVRAKMVQKRELHTTVLEDYMDKMSELATNLRLQNRIHLTIVAEAKWAEAAQSEAFGQSAQVRRFQ